jgi:hypothetical protein
MDWKKNLRIILVSLFLMILQTGFFSELFGEIFPILIFCYSLGLFALGKTEESYLSAFVGGLLLDLVSSNFLGFSSTVFLSALLAGVAVRKVFSNSVLSHIFAIVLFQFIYFLFSLDFAFDFVISLTFWVSVFSNYVTFLLFTFLLRKFSYASKPF